MEELETGPPPRTPRKEGRKNSTVKEIMRTEAQEHGLTISDSESPLNSFLFSTETQSNFEI